MSRDCHPQVAERQQAASIADRAAPTEMVPVPCNILSPSLAHPPAGRHWRRAVASKRNGVVIEPEGSGPLCRRVQLDRSLWVCRGERSCSHVREVQRGVKQNGRLNVRKGLCKKRKAKRGAETRQVKDVLSTTYMHAYSYGYMHACS